MSGMTDVAEQRARAATALHEITGRLTDKGDAITKVKQAIQALADYAMVLEKRVAELEAKLGGTDEGA